MARIDTTETMNSLFGGLAPPQIADIAEHLEPERKAPEITKEPEIKQSPKKPQQKDKEADAPKWLTLDKVTVLLTTQQKTGLDLIAKKIMKFRSKDLKGCESKERITSNTLIRCLIDHLLRLEDSIQIEVIKSENDVHTWLGKVFK